MLSPRPLVGSDHLEVLADEDVMGPVDPDVVDLVVAVAQPDDTIDDAAWIGCKGGLRCLPCGGAADDRAGALLVVGRDLADRLRGAGRSARKGTTVEAVFEVPADGCGMTCAAVMVVLSTVPITSAV
jgi:hypothetical protein